MGKINGSMRHIAFLITTILLSFNAATAQHKGNKPPAHNKPFQLGIIDGLKSTFLGENRVLNIYLPDGYYKDSSKSYPVIYLLDGSANEDFIHITGLVQFLTMIETIQPTIVVGIANIDRRRDFTFPTTIAKDKKDYPTTGESGKFMEFLEKELEPYVRGKYRTGGTRTIIGQSLGGLLATEILLKKPWLFDQYFIVSPSLWWDNESLLASAPGLLKSLTKKEISVYIAVGNEGSQMENDARNLANLLKTQAGENVKVMLNPMPAEDHLTILHNSVYQAFQKMTPKK